MATVLTHHSERMTIHHRFRDVNGNLSSIMPFTISRRRLLEDSPWFRLVSTIAKPDGSLPKWSQASLKFECDLLGVATYAKWLDDPNDAGVRDGKDYG
jgi:hypothetical protein